MKTNTKKKKKIVHIINKVGPDILVLDLVKNFDNERFDVTIISYLNSQQEVDNFGYDLNIVGIGTGRKVDWRPIKNLYSILREKDIDILHTHDNFSGSVGRVLGKLANIPLSIDTEHNDHKGFKISGLLLNAATINIADVIICNSKNTFNSFFWWENALINKNKKTLIYNGIGVEKIISLTQHKGDKNFRDTVNIVTVGRLVEQKNQETLIKAVAKVKRDVILTIVGAGKLKSKLEKLTKKLGIEKKVKFTGLLERNKVYKILKDSDIFVMPSLFEGFCNAVVEAMASGLPIIASDVEPLPEVLGDTAIFVGVKDYDEFAEKIEYLIDNPEESKRLGRMARKRAEREYPIERMAEKYKEVYMSSIITKDV